MLEQLLSEIRKNRTLQPGVLAARLNLSTAMVEAMLDHLKSTGVLQSVDTGCHQACRGCSLAGGCIPAIEKGRLWRF